MKKILSYILLPILILAAIFCFKFYKQSSLLQDLLGHKFKTTEMKIHINDALNKKNIIPIAVIGSGPAGLSAALYGARASVYTVVFDGPKPGGQLTETSYVENWPGTPKLLGSELIELNRQQAQKFGAVFVNESIDAVDFSVWPFRLQTESGDEVHALSVVIATGANPRLLNVPGEKEYWAYGVTACAVCDAPFYKDKDVVVVGGGDSAIEEATLLSSYAKNVTMLVRGAAMRASPAMQRRLKGYPNISVMYNTSISRILGDTKTVNKIELVNANDKSKTIKDIDGVFLAIGHEPNTEIFKNFIKTDSTGHIVTNCLYKETNIKGIFAVGDVEDTIYKQAGTSAGDGIKGGMNASSFINSIPGVNAAVLQKLEKNYYDVVKGPKVEIKHLVTDKDLDDLAKNSKFLVVEVGSENCPSCKVLLASLESVAAKNLEQVSFGQISFDDNPKELITRFELKSVPVLLIFKDGKLVKRFNQEPFSKFKLYSLINNLIYEE